MQHFNADELLRLGVDLGGTKTEVVVLSIEGDRPQIRARVRGPTGREHGYEHVVANTAALVGEATRQAGLPRPPPVGVGMPGSMTFLTPDGGRSGEPLVKNANTTCLNGRPFFRDLRAALGRNDVVFANDANCFALAEACFGAARGARVAFGVIMGTGVGGGVVFAPAASPPTAWEGAQSIAGEWGHVALEPDRGPPCYCGRRGCVECYLARPAVERAYAQRSGTPRPLPEIAARAREDDEAARATLDELSAFFGRALSVVVNVLDPDVIVLGGGVSNLDALYTSGVRELARWVFNDELRTKIVKHELGDSAGVLGAALLTSA